MTSAQRDTLRALLKRAEEVRGLDEGAPDAAFETEPGDAVLATLEGLVEELERSHRRLIETNVQLVSLREVASHLTTHLDAGETTRTVTRYLAKAFGFDEVFLLLVNREARRLEGTWTRNEDPGRREHSLGLEVPLLGDHGAIPRCVWLNRTVVHHGPRLRTPAILPDGHPLQEIIGGLGSLACVPLQRSHALPGGAAPHELCGERCILGEALVLAPPPGPAAERWAVDREERQSRCLSCELLPVLGAIGVARDASGPPLTAADVTLIESIALSVAPVVENARLYQDLRKSERFRDHVLDSMAAALVAVDMSGDVLTFNRAAEQLLGFREGDVLGDPFGQLVGPDGEEAVRATLEHGREARREEVLLRGKDGVPVPVSLTTSLLRNEKRGVYGAIATFVDLRPLKRAEEHARRLDRLAALGRFTSSVAHEIRNPLTGIAAGVQYLARAFDPDGKQRENLDFLLREIKRLDRIVQDLFDITHPRELRLEIMPLEDTVRRGVQAVQALADGRGVRVALELEGRVPPVPHDADQFEQVVINLVKNAIEASGEGGAVEVSVTSAHAARRKPPAPDAPTPAAPKGPPGAVLRVIDHGPGIGAEHLKTIFEPFYTTKPGGTGLGLYITDDIVKRHGGSLSVQSEPGSGTRFTVELPLDRNGGNP